MLLALGLADYWDEHSGDRRKEQIQASAAPPELHLNLWMSDLSLEQQGVLCCSHLACVYWKPSKADAS